MNSLIDWLNGHTYQTRTRALIALVVAPLALLGVVAWVFPIGTPVLGALCGTGQFLAIYGYWHTMTTPETRAAHDFKQRYAVHPRRRATGAALGLWVIILLVLGPHLPGPAVGTVNVLVLLCLYWLWRATPTETATALANYEAAQAAATDPASTDPVDPETGTANP